MLLTTMVAQNNAAKAVQTSTGPAINPALAAG